MKSEYNILDGLLKRAPKDFQLVEVNAKTAIGTYRVSARDSVRPTTYEIAIAVINGSVHVRERVPGTLLPENCPERHINPNRTFCLGLDAGSDLVTNAENDDWWSLLGQFLRVQVTASRTKRWPRHLMLSHGDAGYMHAEAIAIAKRLGIDQDYEQHLIGDQNWISDLVTTYDDRRTEFRLKSLPTVHVDSIYITGAEDRVSVTSRGRKLTSRKRKRLLRQLLVFEFERSRREHAFWASYIQNRTPCCGTMIGCPLVKGVLARLDSTRESH